MRLAPASQGIGEALRIVVCVKHVPDTRVPIRLDPQSNRLDPADVVGVLNPADACAVELAVLLAEGDSGEVILISMGPVEARTTLRQGLALGAHRAILICDDALKGSDAYVTATVLGRLAKSLNPDIVLCGASSLDGATGQVGAGVAEAMEISHVSGVASVSVEGDGTRVVVLRKLERGHREKLESTLPVLLTVDVDLVTPRYPALPAWLAALQANVETVDLSALGIPRDRVGQRGSLTRVLNLAPPRPRPKRIFTPSSSLSAKDRMKAILSGGVSQRKSSLLDGTPAEVTRQVVDFLTKERAMPAEEDAS